MIKPDTNKRLEEIDGRIYSRVISFDDPDYMRKSRALADQPEDWEIVQRGGVLRLRMKEAAEEGDADG